MKTIEALVAMHHHVQKLEHDVERAQLALDALVEVMCGELGIDEEEVMALMRVKDEGSV